MNIKNNDNLTKIHFPTQKVMVFYPVPVERMGDKDLHRTIIYNEMGIPYAQTMAVRQSFEGYAMQIAYEAGINDPKKMWTESSYGVQLADGEVFIPLTLQHLTPTIGYLNLFAIKSLYLNQSMGTNIYMDHNVIVSCITTTGTVLKKINNAGRFYDPEGLRYPKEGIPFRLMAPPTALPEDIVVGNINENPLALHTEEDIRLACGLCNHILATPPQEIFSVVNGLQRKLSPVLEKINNDREIRAQGIAAGNGTPMIMDSKTNEKMVPWSLLEAERAEKEKYKEQAKLFLEALQV